MYHHRRPLSPGYSTGSSPIEPVELPPQFSYVPLNYEPTKPPSVYDILRNSINELEKENKYQESRIKSLKIEQDLSLPEKLDKIFDSMDDYFRCSVCYDDYDSEDRKKTKLECGHYIFCNKCLKKVFEEHIRCPECMEKNPGFDIVPNFMDQIKEIKDKSVKIYRKARSKKRKRTSDIKRKKKKRKIDRPYTKEDGKYHCNHCNLTYKTEKGVIGHAFVDHKIVKFE